MRILLVKPKPRLRTVLGLQGFSLLEPLELGYLAAAVSPSHSVRVADLRLVRAARRSFLRALRRFRPDVVGISGYSHEASEVKRLARLTREALPRATVVVGGHHATVAPEDYDTDAVDAIVRGEGCGPFRAIIEALPKRADLAGIANVLVPGRSFDRAAASSWPTYPDPATLPRPRRDLWDPRSYRSVWVSESAAPWQSIFPRVAMVRTSYGCRMKCTFCVVPLLCGGRHMPRPVEDVVEEIASLQQAHVYFCDDENFIDEDYAAALAQGLAARGVRKRYLAWARATTVNRSPELFRAWRKIGLDSAFLGFEFANDEELQQVAKGSSVKANERALDRLRSEGVAAHAAFMVNAEYSEAQFAHLTDYVRALPPAQCSFTVCTPSPGTPDYEAIKPRIWVDAPYDLHDCMHPLTPTAIPLRRFAHLYAGLAAAGTARTPLRHSRHPLPPRDMLRIPVAEWRYRRGYRTLYRDYPRECWG